MCVFEISVSVVSVCKGVSVRNYQMRELRMRHVRVQDFLLGDLSVGGLSATCCAGCSWERGSCKGLFRY